jgi:hypothetical protein
MPLMRKYTMFTKFLNCYVQSAVWLPPSSYKVNLLCTGGETRIAVNKSKKFKIFQNV